MNTVPIITDFDVICIDVKFDVDLVNREKCITINKKYNVNYISLMQNDIRYYYRIVDNDGNYCFYLSTRFKLVNEYRHDKINSILE